MSKSTANLFLPSKSCRRSKMSSKSFFGWFSETQQKEEMEEIHNEVVECVDDHLFPSSSLITDR
ncbi:hypothetical protein HanPI659440_Chr13g0498801 [Helianthus annuus]|nr:hypothetical protein HanPI659440_Chr13g0498801 [Helianthus annuus]